MARKLTILLLLLCCTFALKAQERPFPYPAIPETMRQPQERLVFLLERYWSLFCFDDSTAVNRATEEQGFVDYIDLLQYADSAVAAKSVRIFADSIGKTPQRQQHFDGLIDHYLGNPESPMRNDVTYAHLLRVLPTTPQRTFLLGEVTRNQPGKQAADIKFVADGATQPLQLSGVESPLMLLVFHDPDCEHCQQMLPQIKQSSVLSGKAQQLKIFYINIEAEENRAIRDSYYLPALPSLYLLDAEKRVVIKDGSLQRIEAFLQQ